MYRLGATFQRFGMTIVLGTSLWGLSVPATGAVQLADGTVAFAKPPRLLDAITTFRTVGSRSAKYYFTLQLPQTADEPLQKITVHLRQGSDEIDYRLDKTIAAVGTARDKAESIAIKKASFDAETETVTVTFAQPIPPGTTFTLGLRPKHNPNFDGIYLFGVTAFPAGDKSQGIYLGSARLVFEKSTDSDFSLND